MLPGRSLAHPPGASQTGGASTTRSIDGHSLRHDLHIARRVPPKGTRRAMPFFGRHRGEPRPLPFDRPSERTRLTCRPDHGGRRTDLRHRSRDPAPAEAGRCLCGAPSVARCRCRPDHVGRRTRPPLPETPDPVTCRSRLRCRSGAPGCRFPGSWSPSTPFTLTRFPASSLSRRPVGSRTGQLGCPVRGRPGTSPPDSPVSRRAVPRSTVASCPVRTRYVSWNGLVNAPQHSEERC